LRVVIEANEICAAKLLSVDLYELTAEMGLFSKEITSVVKQDIIGAVIEREQALMKRRAV
jgi:hypothetical protein